MEDGVDMDTVGESLASAATAPDPGLALIAQLARVHRRAFSETALRAALPEGLDLTAPENMVRALSHVGLRAALVSQRPGSVDPGVLPCVIFRRDGSPVLLTAQAGGGRRFRIVDPGSGAEQDLPRRVLRREFGRRVLLVAPQIAEAAPDAGASTPNEDGHWFWGALRANRGAIAQVFVAALCLNLLTLAVPLFVMNVYDRVIPNLAFVTLWTLAIGVLLALLLDFALRSLRVSVLESLARRVDLGAAARLFDQMMHARLLSRPGGAAGMANAIRDFETVRDFFGSASFVAMIDLLFIGVFVAALFFIVGPLAWVPLCAVPVVLVFALLAQVPLSQSADQAQRLATKRHVVLVETLLGIEAVKSLNAEPVMQREWENAVAASSRIGGRTRFWSGFATSATQFVQQGVSVVIIFWGVYLVSEQRITIGALIAANILSGRVLAPLAAVAQTLFRANYARRAMAVLNEIMELPRETGSRMKSSLRIARGDIALRNVTFRYPGTDQPALADLSLDIRAGERVALLGRVGSGKTTTGKLLNGLLQADSGTILIDGHGISQYEPAELRQGVGYLTQESELFTGTLRENLTIGRPGASDEEIRQALYLAGIDEFAAAHPEGLNLFIGEKGNRLSGGQRQGVALARLLLRKPRVLFLDEPTNAMDLQMETAVIQRLGAFGAGRITMIFCTHRMSLAEVADRFIVLDRGRKALDGPRDEVLARLRAAQPAPRMEG